MTETTSLQRAFTCQADDCVLIIVDVQERLGDAMPRKVLNRVVANTTLLTRSADLMDIPVLHTEQYPRGLGTTLPSIMEALPSSVQSFEKTSFSCCAAEGFRAALDALKRQQVVIVGMESHVCVLQTALDLCAAGLQVFVAEDAICSRRLENYQNALERMRQATVGVVSAESVVFEWMGSADHPKFKPIQAMLR
jgi:nicotinamidase-related amidase